MKKNLNKIFNPEKIAVIGASNQPHTIGYALINNLIGKGYNGIVYPVNQNEASILGVRCYRQLKDIQDTVDLAIIATPAETIPDLIEECGACGVGGAVIISAGFLEAGEKGQDLTKQVMASARKYNMRIIGPNCLGLINPRIQLNATFADSTALPGKIAFISQSGALCTSILRWAKREKVGFSQFVSIGDMIDLGFHDLIDYFGTDPNTSSILIYMESLKNARRFISAARAFARNKPILVLKAGKSKEGARATLSHTGSLAGNDAVFEAALRRAGIIRVETINQLFDCAKALGIQKRPLGNRLAIITNAGGPGVLATDHLIQNGGVLAPLQPKTIDQLNEILPPTWSHGNPVDLQADASAERYREATRICLADPTVDGILIIQTPQAITKAQEVEDAILPLAQKTSKTILGSWMGEDGEVLPSQQSKLPHYRFPESAVDVFLKMYRYSENIEILYETPLDIPDHFSPDTQAARNLLNKALAEGRQQLTEPEAKKLLTYFDMPITHSELATSPEEAVQLAEKIGYPVVLKIVSPDIGLKTDIGGVRLNLRTPQEVEDAYSGIISRVSQFKPDSEIYGITVEKMISKRHELLIGANKDPIFGPVIVFGMGGIAVELFKDSNIGLPPLNMALAQHIIEGTKVYELLKGYRGMPGVEIRTIQFMLYKFAYLVMDLPQIKEIDINPFVVDQDGGIVLDAYVILDRNYRENPLRPYSHLVISPYPKQYEHHHTLPDGREVFLRPIRPEDEPLEAEMISNLSKQTQYFRYFGYIANVSKELLRRSTQIDYDREIAIIAEVQEDGRKKMIGEVRLLGDADYNNAEFAIVVSDNWQKQGLGSYLADYIIKIAEERGVQTIYASVLKANKRMVQMFQNRGFQLKSEGLNTYQAVLQLTTEHVEP
jgi:acetyltransferase